MGYHSKAMLLTYPHWWEDGQVHVIHHQYIDNKWRQFINVYNGVYQDGTITDSLEFKRMYGNLNFKEVV